MNQVVSGGGTVVVGLGLGGDSGEVGHWWWSGVHVELSDNRGGLELWWLSGMSVGWVLVGG